MACRPASSDVAVPDEKPMGAAEGARIQPSPLPPTLTMPAMQSQPQLQEVGGSSGAPSSVSSLAKKRKRPRMLNKKKQSNAKRVKSPTTVSVALKRPTETSAQKQVVSKRFKPPMAVSPMVTRSPMMRLIVSPVVMGARSTALSPQISQLLTRSPSPNTTPPPSFDDRITPTQTPGTTSVQSKPRKLKYDIWKDMDPIYQGGKLVQARCKHCNEVFSATRNSENSHMHRHLGVCEPRLKMIDMVEKLQASIVSTEATVLSN